jgi:hypothetical protein
MRDSRPKNVSIGGDRRAGAASCWIVTCLRLMARAVGSGRFVQRRFARFVAQARQFLVAKAFVDLEYLSRSV